METTSAGIPGYEDPGDLDEDKKCYKCEHWSQHEYDKTFGTCAVLKEFFDEIQLLDRHGVPILRGDEERHNEDGCRGYFKMLDEYR